MEKHIKYKNGQTNKQTKHKHTHTHKKKSKKKQCTFNVLSWRNESTLNNHLSYFLLSPDEFKFLLLTNKQTKMAKRVQTQ